MPRPVIRKLGTLDCDMVETTPVAWRGWLYRFEYVRTNYQPNATGNSYFRFIEVATGQATPAFASGYHLGCAHAEDDAMYCYGVSAWGANEIRLFRSVDLERWESQPALKLPGCTIFNTSVCRGPDRYVMAVEIGEPPEVVGVPFTMVFAESPDLVTWRQLPKECVFTKDRYSACPALRYVNGYYYMVYLEAAPGPTYFPGIVRSRDLVDWGDGTIRSVMEFSPEDKLIANPALTDEQRRRIASAVDINNSDVDLCEFAGKVVIYYSWGNQQGNEFLAEAEYEGTLQDFVEGFFAP